jgi:hypothetical protein
MNYFPLRVPVYPALFKKSIPQPKPHVDCSLKAQQNKKKKNRIKNKQARKARKKSRR